MVWTRHKEARFGEPKYGNRVYRWKNIKRTLKQWNDEVKQDPEKLRIRNWLGKSTR